MGYRGLITIHIGSSRSLILLALVVLTNGVAHSYVESGLSRNARSPRVAPAELEHPTALSPSIFERPTGETDARTALHPRGGGDIPPHSPLENGVFVNFESPQVKPLALSSDGNTLFATNTPNNRLVVLSTQGGLNVVREIPVGLDPVAVAVQPGTGDQFVWVANFISDNVSVVDVSSGKVVSVIDVGDEPVNILFDPLGTMAFVVVQGIGPPGLHVPTPTKLREGNVVVIDPVTRRPISCTFLDCNTPRAAVFDSTTNRLIVAALHSGNNTTVVGAPIDLGPDRTTILQVIRDFPLTAGLFAATPGLGVWPDLHVGPGFPESPKVHRIVYDLGTPGGWQAIVAALADENGAPDPAVAAQMNGFFAVTNAEEVIQIILDESSDTVDHDLIVLDTSNSTSPGGLPVLARLGNIGTTLTSMSRNPDSGTVLVTNMEPRNVERLLPNLRGHLVDHQVVTVSDVTDPQSASRIDLHDGVIGFHQVDVPNAAAQATSLANPVDVVVDNEGRFAFVAALGPGRIGALNAQTGEVVGRIDVGRGPRGLALDSQGNRLYVMNRTDLSISVVDITDPTQMTTSGPFALFNPEPAEIRDGRDFLYGSRFTNNYATSCAVCHVDANLDHLVWDLGNPQGELQPGPPNLGLTNHPIKGPMVTQSLRGLRNHNSYHWRSDKPAFQDFNEAFVHLLGAQEELSSGDMDAFTAFVETIAYPPSPFYTRENHYSDPRALAGAVLYGDNCQACHQIEHDGSLNGASMIPPVAGDGGVDLSDGGLFAQLQEVPQFRGVFKRFQSDRWNGFGLLHDGRIGMESNENSIQSFLTRFFSAMSAEDQLDMIAFLNSFQSNVMSVVGWQVLAEWTPAPAGQPNIAASVFADVSLMAEQHWKDPSHCDVVGHGSVGGVVHGFYLTGSSPDLRFTSDIGAQNTLDELFMLMGIGDVLTFSAVPPGSGRRIGIDQDVDCLADGLDPFPQFNNAADGDLDGHVGVLDFLALVDCAGFNGPLSVECTLFDLDCSGVVDHSDAAGFLTHYEDPIVDCTGNGVADLLDIFNGTAPDANRNGIADHCVSFSAEAAGARYLKVQVAGLDGTALRVTSPQYPCLLKYVDADGYLVDAPVTRTPSQWGTVFIGDLAIVPSSSYLIESEIGGELSNPAILVTRAWGEVNGTDPLDIDDILCVLNSFVGAFSQCSLYEVDMMGEVPNRLVDVDDLLAALDGFVGHSYPFAGPCD